MASTRTAAARTYARPTEHDSQAAHEAANTITRYLALHKNDVLINVATSDEDSPSEPLAVPRPAVELFASILDAMADGRGVSVVPETAELTTQQAADILNVSRPFLIGLLDAREIDYRLVGTHRRITASSLFAYLEEDDARRGVAADELTALGDE